MKVKSLLVVAAVAACGALVATNVAGARVLSADTKVTIKGPNGDFYGKLFSVSKSCLSDRKVTVYKQKGAVQNRTVDKKIASDTSERHGDYGAWSVGNTGFKHGKFYARAGSSPGCKAGSSKTITL